MPDDIDALVRMGEAAVPRLQQIRRQGPGQLRAPALRALADVSGSRDFDAKDLGAVERLIRTKLLDERPVTIPTAGRWIAFPADQLDTVVSVWGLHDLRAATTAMGLAAATVAPDTADFTTADGSSATAYRVFITPEFKNWRLLYGNSFLDQLGGHELAEKASEQCGEAHFYTIDPYHNADVWWVARNGEVVRGYATYGDPEWVGDPLPFEVEFIEMDEDDLWYDPYFAEKYSEGVTDAHKAAEELSVEPGPVRERDTHGHGWLATTHPDVPTSHFKGALPI
ncbi:hypothetical protein [Streptomyces sp. NPDC093591]|uniref:hypothetical protein n=1 Tax=Streptomyces sp. NPDC093591 TaxID=3366044 RepID=UPI0038220264